MWGNKRFNKQSSSSILAIHKSYVSLVVPISNKASFVQTVVVRMSSVKVDILDIYCITGLYVGLQLSDLHYRLATLDHTCIKSTCFP